MAVRIVKHAMEIIHLLTDLNPIQVIVDAVINRYSKNWLLIFFPFEQFILLLLWLTWLLSLRLEHFIVVLWINVSYVCTLPLYTLSVLQVFLIHAW